MRWVCHPPSPQVEHFSVLPLSTRSVEICRPVTHCTCCPVIIIKINRVRHYIERVFLRKSRDRPRYSIYLTVNDSSPAWWAYIPPSVRSSIKTLDCSLPSALTTDLTFGRRSRYLCNGSDIKTGKVSTHSFNSGFLINSVVRDAGSLIPNTGTFW
jgi:hypothetical protein